MRTHLRLAVTLCALSLAACKATPADHQDPPPSEEIPADAGDDQLPPDAGLPPEPEGPKVSAQERLGAYTGSPAASVLTGQKTSVVLFGGVGAPFNPRWIGQEKKDNSFENWIHAGLIAVDSDTGKARVFTDKDGLPLSHYVDMRKNIDYGMGTARIMDLAWLTPDTTFAAATVEHLTVGTSDGKGGYTFRSITLRAPNQTADMNVVNVALAGGELFAAGDEGVVALDPATLAVKRWYHLGANAIVPPAWTFGLSAGELNGPVVAVVYGANGSLLPDKVALLRPGNATPTVIDFANDTAKPLSVFGMEGRVLVGVKEQDKRGAIRALSWDGSAVKMSAAVTADDLATSSYGSVLPAVMAFDPKQGVLLVGGTIHGAMPAQSAGYGGGFVKLSATVDGQVGGQAQDILPANHPLYSRLPVRLSALTVDSKGRWYFGGSGICSETTARQLDVLRADFDSSNEIRLVRPLLTGVRAMATEPTQGNLMLALADENPGLACSGVNAQQGLCTLKADGSCELFAAQVNTGYPFTTTPVVSSLAFGKPDQKEMAFATQGDGLFVRAKDTAEGIVVMFDPGLNKHMTSVRYGTDGLWAGSIMQWSPDENDPSLDTVKINERGPHGLGFFELDASGKVTKSVRYVRHSTGDSGHNEIAGMPSNTVWDVLPLSGAKTALAACGIERDEEGIDGESFEHVLPPPNKRNFAGGIALVTDTKIDVFAAPKEGAYTDVVAFAKVTDGTIWAVDTALGILKVDVANKTATVWKAPDWKAPVRPLSLTADDHGHLVVGTTKGLFVYGTDKVQRAVATDAGYVWTVRFVGDDVLYAGTDQGLVRIALEDKALPAKLGPTGLLGTELWPLPPPCGGVDGCACTQNTDCQTGYDCLCDKNAGCSCQPSDPCAASPAPNGCTCSMDTDCAKGLKCNCDQFGNCGCGFDPTTCDGTANCPCTSGFECPSGFYCNPAKQCAAKQTCDRDCSCATTSKCSPGLRCQSGIAGSSCVE